MFWVDQEVQPSPLMHWLPHWLVLCTLGLCIVNVHWCRNNDIFLTSCIFGIRWCFDCHSKWLLQVWDHKLLQLCPQKLLKVKKIPLTVTWMSGTIPNLYPLLQLLSHKFSSLSMAFFGIEILLALFNHRSLKIILPYLYGLSVVFASGNNFNNLNK